ncbi:DUF7668 domain-containing protein [Sphingopyxis chilensis]|uniref:DUF7668 domain-containing protein n=1 Tax=Sphingopyxis chilensis TaxID=180400 RepID=UPI002DDD9D92|nr:hypothetical protein [Sphingopyxis chilensis]
MGIAAAGPTGNQLIVRNRSFSAIRADLDRMTGIDRLTSLAIGFRIAETGHWGNARVLERNDVEHPVPLEWRIVFHDIADAFASGDFTLRTHVIDRASPIDLSTAALIADSISTYGDPIAPLRPATWDRAVYRWMDGYWQFLVDLTTESEDVSDLTLHATLQDEDNARIEVRSVHVP